MLGIVEFPSIVQAAIETYKNIFINEPERRHFGEYLTGLIIAERKTVNGINSEFANTTDQSCLNRWITGVTWDVEELNRQRIESLQKDHSTRFSYKGTIAIDNVLVDHDGKLIEDVGWMWDHAENRNKIAHDYLIVNYVCQSGKHYPLEFRRFIKKDICEERSIPFKSHTDLFNELVDWVISNQIPGDFVFDSYFTNSNPLIHINTAKKGYVGDLKFNRKILFNGKEIHASDISDKIPPENRKSIEYNGKKQWYFTKTCQIPSLDHRVRLLMLWKHRNDKSPAKILITNRVMWEAKRIQSVYKKRWSGTEPFHRDGKQLLGMGDCQLRNGQSQTRHMHLVFLAYSLLLPMLKNDHLNEWSKVTLNTIGEACRFVSKETLGKAISWSIDMFSKNKWKKSEVIMALGLVQRQI